MVRVQRKWFEFCIYTSGELAITPGTPLLFACLSNPRGRWQSQEVTNHREWQPFSLLKKAHDDHLFSRAPLHL
jgi:hypothetical protein